MGRFRCSCILLLVLAVFFASCVHSRGVQDTEALATEEANLVLRLWNQSFDVCRAEFCVWIDGQPSLQEHMHVGRGLRSGHNPKEFYLRLPEGEHTLEARVYNGDELLAAAEASFRLQEKKWAIVDFFKRKGEGGEVRVAFEDSQPVYL